MALLAASATRGQIQSGHFMMTVNLCTLEYWCCTKDFFENLQILSGRGKGLNKPYGVEL
jgi:hypothetical protein